MRPKIPLYSYFRLVAGLAILPVDYLIENGADIFYYNQSSDGSRKNIIDILCDIYSNREIFMKIYEDINKILANHKNLDILNVLTEDKIGNLLKSIEDDDLTNASSLRAKRSNPDHIWIASSLRSSQ